MAAGRYDILNRVLQLDPRTQNQEIVQLVGFYEYPWMLRKSLEFALFRTYAVPSISGLLAHTRQFHLGGQKRYDDTSLLIAEITENGYDSERGRAAIRRMNQLHRRWNIPNADFLYVLSTFIYVPIYFHERFGWRTPTPHENLANYYFWVEIGRRMGITDIPATYDAFEQFHHAYEAQHFHYTESNRQIADLTVNTFLAWYAAPLRPLVREGLYTLMDDALLRAFGYPKPHPLLTALVQGALKTLGTVIRLVMPPRRTPFYLTRQPNRTYPHGVHAGSPGATRCAAV
ncbi:DUF2236 domain-containing protein [bacterium]|nr:DUF2236 domain-containing protein [bacterium]